jgi:hypothetical protein
MIHELEKASFTLSGGKISSTVTTTTDTSTAAIASLSAQISTLSAQVAALPALYMTYPGKPPDSMGSNGQTSWDTRSAAEGGQIEYRKLGGTWRQV